MSYCQEPDSHIRDNVKTELELTNFVTKEEVDHVTGVHTSHLDGKKHFVDLKA